MKRKRATALTASVATLAAVGLAGAAAASPSSSGSGSTRSVSVTPVASDSVDPGGSGSGGWRANGTGRGSGNGSGHRQAGSSGDHSDLPLAVDGATITDEVEAELRYLVEEEKLAGDVYELAQSLYGDRVFTNIARAEDNHADAVRVLLDRYDVNDPTSGVAAGEFENEELQALYNQLAVQVRASWAEAIEAGITIEETDIADLETLLSQPLPADVEQVAANLLAGSQRHLSALERQTSSTDSDSGSAARQGQGQGSGRGHGKGPGQGQGSGQPSAASTGWLV